MIKSNPRVFFAASFEISFDTSSVVVRAISSFSMELFNGNNEFADVSFRVKWLLSAPNISYPFQSWFFPNDLLEF